MLPCRAQTTPIATKMPAKVPNVRWRDLASAWPRENVPVNITNTVMTAQYQRSGESITPPRIASAAAAAD